MPEDFGLTMQGVETLSNIDVPKICGTINSLMEPNKFHSRHGKLSNSLNLGY